MNTEPPTTRFANGQSIAAARLSWSLPDKSMTSYAELFAKLKAADDGWESIGPQPATRVDEIESKFGIRLPQSFRQYLIEVGGIEYPNHYYTSIDDDYLDEQDGFLCNTNMLRGWPRLTRVAATGVACHKRVLDQFGLLC